MDKYIQIGKTFCIDSIFISSVRLFGLSSIIVGIDKGDKVIEAVELDLGSSEEAVRTYNRIKRILLSRNAIVFVGTKKLKDLF